jgi:hypothetical protein
MAIDFPICINIICYYLEKMVNDTTLAIIAIVTAIGLLGLVVVETISVQQQQAKAAGCESGLPNSARGFNASQGRCFGH